MNISIHWMKNEISSLRDDLLFARKHSQLLTEVLVKEKISERSKGSPSYPVIKKCQLRRAKLWLSCPRCVWCNKNLFFEEATIEHVLPKSHGGQGIAISAIACHKCNQNHGNSTVKNPEKLCRPYQIFLSASNKDVRKMMKAGASLGF